MSVFTILIFIYLSQNAVDGTLPESSTGEVIYANVLFRHGDRNIITAYANDPNKDKSNWPDGLGQLTNIGKQQEYALGQWLRRRYDRLLTDQYSRDLLYVRSTDVDRTLMSAKCVLAGMFPPRGQQVWNNQLKWQPIPTHTVPEGLDKVLAQKHPCPEYQREYEQLLNSPEIGNITARYSDIMKILSENAGEKITSLKDINWMYHDLYIEKVKNMTVPGWALDIFPAMHEASSYCFALPTWNRKLARLKSGLLVEELMNNLKAKRDGHTTLTMSLYAAHDTTVASLLSTLGLRELRVPPYAATVMMELRKDPGGSYNVMLSYYNSTGADPYLLTVPGCLPLSYYNSTGADPYLLTVPGCLPVCPLDQLINLTLPIIPQDWDKECQIS